MTAKLYYVMTARGAAFWLHSLLLSLLTVIAWFARPETILISGAMAGVITLRLGTAVIRGTTAWSAVELPRVFFGPPIFALIIANVGVAALNGVYFGRFTPVEALRAPAFVRAYDDLQGIVGQTPIHYVPVSNAQMEVAAPVSPAFAEIYGTMQGKLGDPYRRNSKIYAGVDSDEIAGGWFIWLLRSAVSETGYQNIAAKTNSMAVCRRVGGRRAWRRGSYYSTAGGLDRSKGQFLDFFPATFAPCHVGPDSPGSRALTEFGCCCASGSGRVQSCQSSSRGQHPSPRVDGPHEQAPRHNRNALPADHACHRWNWGDPVRFRRMATTLSSGS